MMKQDIVYEWYARKNLKQIKKNCIQIKTVVNKRIWNQQHYDWTRVDCTNKLLKQSDVKSTKNPKHIFSHNSLETSNRLELCPFASILSLVSFTPKISSHNWSLWFGATKDIHSSVKSHFMTLRTHRFLSFFLLMYKLCIILSDLSQIPCI